MRGIAEPSEPERPVKPTDDSVDSAFSTRLEHITWEFGRLLKEKGYSATSLGDVAQVVNINKASLYHYISSKEELLYRLLMLNHRRYMDNMAEISAVDVDSMSRLRAFITGHIQRIEPHLATGLLIHREYYFLTKEHRDQLLGLRREYEGFLASILEDCAREGSIRDNVDVPLTATAILTLLNSVNFWYQPTGRLTLNEVAASYVDLLMLGVQHADQTESIAP
jgi:AcrR family transcriptional regulator